jgi:hypothetical protein
MSYEAANNAEELREDIEEAYKKLQKKYKARHAVFVFCPATLASTCSIDAGIQCIVPSVMTPNSLYEHTMQ